MALPVIAINQTVAIAALKEGLSLCQSIMEYRLATQQIELQRDRMHIEANAVMQQLDYEHKAKLDKLNAIAHAHKITLTDFTQSSANSVKMIDQCQVQIQQCLNMITSTTIAEDLKIHMMTTVSQLSQQQAQLIDSHIQNSRAPINAFAMMLDGLRDSNQPRTFTNVS